MYTINNNSSILILGEIFLALHKKKETKLFMWPTHAPVQKWIMLLYSSLKRRHQKRQDILLCKQTQTSVYLFQVCIGSFDLSVDGQVHIKRVDLTFVETSVTDVISSDPREKTWMRWIIYTSILFLRVFESEQKRMNACIVQSTKTNKAGMILITPSLLAVCIAQH